MRNYHKKNKIVVTLIILLIVILIIGILGYLYISNKENKLKERISDINSHFNQIVITNKNSAIYDKEYNKVGTIEKGVLLSLKEQEEWLWDEGQVEVDSYSIEDCGSITEINY